MRNSPSIWLCRATCQTPLLGAGLSQGTVLPTVGKQGPGDIHNRPSVHIEELTKCSIWGPITAKHFLTAAIGRPSSPTA